MNKLFIVLIALGISLSSFANEGFDKLFSKYSGDESVTTVSVNESMLKMVTKFLGEEDEETKKLMKSITSVKVIASEVKNSKFASEAKALLNSSNYDELMRVNDGNDFVRIMVNESGDIIKDVVVFAESDDEIAFIRIAGNIDPEQIGKALKTLNIKVDGLDVGDLEDLEIH